MKTIARRLVEHLEMDGTANDILTELLYREAHGFAEDKETNLEEVERWAFSVLNRIRAKEYREKK